jgi:hypothetical protein
MVSRLIYTTNDVPFLFAVLVSRRVDDRLSLSDWTFLDETSTVRNRKWPQLLCVDAKIFWKRQLLKFEKNFVFTK